MQTATAYLEDMGISNPLLMGDDTFPDIDIGIVEATSFYIATLAVPKAINIFDPVVQRGESLFKSANCTGCHVQMLMTGESITAQEAYRLGMVNELYPQKELMPAARRIAQRIASNSPTAVQAVKRATRMGMGSPIEQANLIMLEAHYRMATLPDRVEGIRAFTENRDPVFKDPEF